MPEKTTPQSATSKPPVPDSDTSAAIRMEQIPPGKYLSQKDITLLGVYLLIVTAVLLYLLLEVWPRPVLGNNGLPIQPEKWVPEVTLLFGIRFPAPDEARLLLLVLLAGAVGSMIHAIKSFIGFTGSRSLISSWVWWYILRAPLGAMLAVVFYMAVRGGLLAIGAESNKLSVFGLAGIATLVGLFTEQATNKLKEVFDTLFTPVRPVKTPDALPEEQLNPQPEIQKLDPDKVKVGDESQTVRIMGKNFLSDSQVRLDNVPAESEFVSQTELVLKLRPAEVAEAGKKSVTVFNPGPGGGVSSPKILNVGG